MDNLRLAKVVRVHPGSRQVDLKFLDNGWEAGGVHVMSDLAATDCGHNCLPQPDLPDSGNPWTLEAAAGREVRAVVGFASGIPIVMGFIFPEVNGVLFDDPDREIRRHPSDVYQTTDQDGNTEWYHPSGTYMRVGTTAAHEDLTGKDVDGRWKITRNTGKAVYWHVEVVNGGVSKGVIEIDPSGNGTLTLKGAWNVNVSGNANMTVGGDVNLTVNGKVIGSATAWNLKGPLVVDGAISSTGNITAAGDIADQNGAKGTMQNIRLVYNGHNHTDSSNDTISVPLQLM